MNRLARPGLLVLTVAALCAAVLWLRVYDSFERVRVRLVTAAQPPATNGVSIPVRNTERLAGRPTAIVMRVRGASEPVEISVAIDGIEVARRALDAGGESRFDLSVAAFPDSAREVTIAGSRPGWRLTYLELATVHGYAGSPLNLVVTPRHAQPDRRASWWLVTLVLVALAATRPREAWRHASARYAHRLGSALVLLLFLLALLARLITPFSVMLSLQTFLLCVAVLYAEPLSRLWPPIRRRLPPLAPSLEEVSSPLPGAREVLIAGAALSVVIAIVLHAQVRHIASVPDLGDPLFSIWRISWVLHQLTTDPAHLFDANIFYPARLTLTYSDSIILPSLTAAPLLLAGIHPVVVHNLLLLSGFMLSGIATYVLVRSFGWNIAGAWLAGVVFALAAFRIDHYSHLELQMAQWMPLALLGAHRQMTRGGSRALAVTTLAVAAQWYSSMYYALFLSVYVAAFAVVLACVWKNWRRVAHVGLALLLGAALALPLGIAYGRAQRERGVRSPGAVAGLSAQPADYLQPTSRSAVYAELNPVRGQGERQLFPGLAPVALAVGGIWPPLSATRLAVAAAGLVAFDASLGLNGRIYPWLYDYAFPFRSVRVPARFAVLVGLTLALLAGAALDRWTAGTGRRRRLLICAVATVAVVADAWPSIQLVPVWREPPAIYAALRDAPGAVLMEYPLSPDPLAFPENIPYLYFSAWHHTPMVNGYSGFTSPEYGALAPAMKGFPKGQTIDHLRGIGVTHISVICTLDGTFGPYGVPQPYPPRCAEVVAQLDADPRVRLVVRSEWAGEPALLYEMKR